MFIKRDNFFLLSLNLNRWNWTNNFLHISHRRHTSDQSRKVDLCFLYLWRYNTLTSSSSKNSTTSLIYVPSNLPTTQPRHHTSQTNNSSRKDRHSERRPRSYANWKSRIHYAYFFLFLMILHNFYIPHYLHDILSSNLTNNSKDY